jgi:hypothetical protein
MGSFFLSNVKTWTLMRLDRFSPLSNPSPHGIVGIPTQKEKEGSQHLLTRAPSDIETNYIGIHYNDIPKDRDVKTGLIVSILAAVKDGCSN